MNDTLRTIDERRSTRQYLDKEISKEHKEIILNAAINAPTAGNMLLYSIIDVTVEPLMSKDTRFLLQRITNEILSTSVTSDSSYPR